MTKFLPHSIISCGWVWRRRRQPIHRS